LDIVKLEEDSKSIAPAPQQLIVRIMKANFAGVQARDVGFFDGDLYRVEMVTTQKTTGQRVSTSRSVVK
jgi:hypothetical protein